jgi:hypothetical protein
MGFRSMALDELSVDDERAFAGVALYGRLKVALGRSAHRFMVPAADTPASWDRVLFLNLTYWSAETGADVLCNEHIPADVLAHIAWHAVVGRQLGFGVPGPARPPSAQALFFAESIASAFDLYLVGRLLSVAPDSDFITTQVPLMAERAQEGGLGDPAFAALMQEVSHDPERAFEDMRALLLDVSNALFACGDPIAAGAALERFAGHRFEPLLHHYELSNWILYGRAYGVGRSDLDAVVAEADAILRQAPDALAWLAEHWIDAGPRSGGGSPGP